MCFLPLLMLPLVALVCGRRLPHPPIFPATQYYPSVCYLPPDSGLCQQSIASADESSLDYLMRYYFDVTTAQCYAFGEQNCGGNENRFRSQEDCQNFCQLGKNNA